MEGTRVKPASADAEKRLKKNGCSSIAAQASYEARTELQGRLEGATKAILKSWRRKNADAAK